MSQTLASASTPTVFFTCTTPGVFVLALEGPGKIYKNSDLILDTGSDTSVNVFLDTGDTLSYKGTGASISGFRSGDEFYDP